MRTKAGIAFSAGSSDMIDPQKKKKSEKIINLAAGESFIVDCSDFVKSTKKRIASKKKQN